LVLKVKCWQIRRHTKAPQAAGTIHTDFERGFICAEVVLSPYLQEYPVLCFSISSFYLPVNPQMIPLRYGTNKKNSHSIHTK